MTTRYINKLPLVKGVLTEAQERAIINSALDILNLISPILNTVLGQVAPGASYLRDGLVAFADGSNWAPAGTQRYAKYSGNFTTVGGDANETITVTGATSSDIAFVMVKTRGAMPRVVESATCATDAVNVVMSGDPSTDHVLSYVVFRSAGKGFYRYDGTGYEYIG